MMRPTPRQFGALALVSFPMTTGAQTLAQSLDGRGHQGPRHGAGQGADARGPHRAGRDRGQECDEGR